MTRRITTIFLAGLTAASACQRHVPQTAPAPNAAGTVNPLPAPLRISKWSITPTDQRFDYQSTRIVSLKHISTIAQSRDSFTTTINFAITPRRSSSITAYVAEIRSIQSSTAQPTLHIPFSFSGHLTENKLKIDAVNGTSVSSVIDCSTGELSFAGIVTQTVITIPAQIETGTTWMDSLSTTACTGPIPGTLSIARTYKTLGGTQVNGLEAVVLELDEKSTLIGEGSQEQHRVQIRGTGSGKGQVMIDAVTGAVISANTHRLALLVVTASGREQQFQQDVSEALTRIR